MHRLVLLTLCTVLGAVSAAVIAPDRAYSSHTPDGSPVLVVPNTLVDDGEALEPPLAANDVEECAAACRQRPGECTWFNYCSFQDGCPVQSGAPLGYQECRLLATCSLQPNHTHSSRITSGFPAHTISQKAYGFEERPGIGIIGADFECAMSLVPGKCASRSAFTAATNCIAVPQCRAVVVYLNGLDGCSNSTLAFLKTEGLDSQNSFISPQVYTLEQSDVQPAVFLRLYNKEGQVLLPTDAEVAASTATGGAYNRSQWLGCLLGSNALVDGEVLAVLENLPSAEACCRACRGYEPGLGCNGWNYCEQEGGCRYQVDNSQAVSLGKLQCELRYQEVSGWPPALLAKGPGVPFTTGLPQAVWAPDLPGYGRLIGRALFSHGRYNCTGSLFAEVQECVQQGNLEELAGYCQLDPRCEAMVYKPGRFLRLPRDIGVMKESANPDQFVLNPTTVLYIKESPAGLSTAAIAGIAVGAAAGLVLLAGVAWLLLGACRRRRQPLCANSGPGKQLDDAGGGSSHSAAAAEAGLDLESPCAKYAHPETQTGLQVTVQPEESREEAAAQDNVQPEVQAGRTASGSLLSPFANMASEVLPVADSASSQSEAGSRPGSRPGSRLGSRSLSKLALGLPAASSSLAYTDELPRGRTQSSTAANRGVGLPPRHIPTARAGSASAAGLSTEHTAAALGRDMHGHMASHQPGRPHLSRGASSACHAGSSSLPQAAELACTAVAVAASMPSSLLGPSTPSLEGQSEGTSQQTQQAQQMQQTQQTQQTQQQAQHSQQAQQLRLLGRRGSASGAAFLARQRSPSPSPRHASAISATPSLPQPADQAAPLPELIQHAAQQERAAAAGTTSSSDSMHELQPLCAESLPARLRDWLVDSSAVTYLHWPSGKLQEIGHGASAHVYKVLYNGEMVAAKEMDVGHSAGMQEAFLTEALRLQDLRHPNVVGFYGVMLRKSHGVVLMEFCEGRDLHSALELVAAGTSQRLFGWYRRGRRVAYEVAKALNYLHSKGIVHMDLKSSNVLLTASGTAKLADVAFSRQLAGTFLSNVQLVGTFAWIAPEVLLGGLQCSQAVDLYSFGVVLWEIVTGECPQRGGLRMPRVPEECPQEVCELMMACLSSEPGDRPTAKQALLQLSQLMEQRVSSGGGSMPGVVRASV